MQTVAQLKQMREKMIEELTQIPQYRALKAMERFMGEIAAIYETPSVVPEAEKPSVVPEAVKPSLVPEAEKAEFHEKIAQAIDNRIKREAAGSAAPQKITPYIPSHRVA